MSLRMALYGRYAQFRLVETYLAKIQGPGRRARQTLFEGVQNHAAEKIAKPGHTK